MIAFQINRDASLKSKTATAVAGVSISAITAAVLYAPFWRGIETISFLKRTDLFTSSFAAVGRLAIAPILGEEMAGAIVRYLALGLFALVFLLLLLRLG
ncbi:MAG: hypothetical protein M1305_05450, partial [Candidatus Marsarchaeota archaeon]|nr:hypothetical protein [Candidatus Marsarchaeota archaeon]